MLLDPKVEHRKFDREVALLKKNSARLQTLGVWIVRMERPEIDAVLVPRLPLRVVMPVPVAPSGPPGQPMQLTGFELAPFAARAFGVRIDLKGYDQAAPSITFRDPWTWDLAKFAALPIGQLVDDPTKPQVVMLDAHPTTKLPFLCLRGVRENHEHDQHDGDDWAIYRASTNVYVLLERLARITIASVRPQILLQFAVPGQQAEVQVQLQTQWAPEIPR
mgnify:CR=1 FL=1